MNEKQNQVDQLSDYDLSDLKNKDPQSEEFQSALEDAAYDRLINSRSNEEFLTNLSIIRSRSASKVDKEHAASSNRDLVSDAKRELLNELNISGTAAIPEIEVCRQAIVEKIKSGDSSSNETDSPLRQLGILQLNSEGKEVFMYPKDLFPAETDEKWSGYIHAVKEHIKISDMLREHTASQQELIDADKTRRAAHNTLSKDIQYLLGFELDDEGFEEARRLVTKMREGYFPNIETGEKSRVDTRIWKGMGKSARANATFYDPEGPAFSKRTYTTPYH